MGQAAQSSKALSDQPKTPLLIVLSGPSGAGKDAAIARLKKSNFPLKFITTLTTRPRRPNEVMDVDYHFVSTGEFQEMIAKNQLLEWANVYGNWYGVPKGPVMQALKQGQHVMVKVDIQGAASIKKIVPEAVFIFLAPPSLDDLILRLKQRHTESPADLAIRLKAAAEEMRQLPLFDYLVINPSDEIDQAVSDIKAIITAEKCRVTPRKIALTD